MDNIILYNYSPLMRSLHVFIKPVKVWWQYAFITTIKAIIDRYKLSTLLFYSKGMFRAETNIVINMVFLLKTWRDQNNYIHSKIIKNNHIQILVAIVLPPKHISVWKPWLTKPVKIWWQYAFITTIKAIIDRYKLSTLLFYLKGMFLIFERVMQYNLVWGSLRLIVVYGLIRLERHWLYLITWIGSPMK
jgi:hypothetical protein